MYVCMCVLYNSHLLSVYLNHREIQKYTFFCSKRFDLLSTDEDNKSKHLLQIECMFEFLSRLKNMQPTVIIFISFNDQ